ncbi:MAG: SPOR domain-containing protein [Sulfurifustis sp.]
MIAKLGFILIVAIFGVLMFIAGAIAPDAIRRPLLGMVGTPTSANPQTAAAPAPAVASSSTPPATESDDLPYDALLLPTPLPAQGLYALQLGSYTEAASADTWMERVRHQGFPVKKLTVKDQNGARWIVVAVGRYASPDEARTARASTARRLNWVEPLAVIRLPADAK